MEIMPHRQLEMVSFRYYDFDKINPKCAYRYSISKDSELTKNLRTIMLIARDRNNMRDVIFTHLQLEHC